MSDDAQIHYGPILTRRDDGPLTLCRSNDWAIMTKERHIVDCRECLALLQPRECAVCHLEHGREVEHSNG